MERASVSILRLLLTSTALSILVGCSVLSPKGAEVAEKGECATCHSFPPSSGAHQIHANAKNVGCSSCHPGSNDSLVSKVSHMNGTVDVSISAPSGYPGLSTYSASDRTCRNVYCHGGLQDSNRIISWNTPLQSSCTSCHSIPPSTGAHQAHSTLMDCNSCHAGFHTADSIRSPAGHVDGIVSVGGNLGSGSYSVSEKSCSDVYCHGAFDGGTRASVSWVDSVSGCVACHQSPPLSGAHESHNSLECSVCHAGYNLSTEVTSSKHHANNAIEVDGALSGGAFTSTSKECSNVYCHGTFAGGQNYTIAWSAKIDGCNSCHPSPPSSGAHAEHSMQDCGECHSGYDLNTQTVSGELHINGSKNVKTTLWNGTFSSSEKSCSNIGCHHGGVKLSWYTEPSCGTCHGIPPTTDAHQEHKTYSCNLCHTGYSSADSSINVGNHANGMVNVDGALHGGTYGAADTSCSNVYCHGAFAGGTVSKVKWSSSITGCTECHAAQPTTGSHPQHSTQKCSDCHTGYDPSTSTASAQKHINAKVDVDATLSGGTYATADKTCSNISCHTGTGARIWGSKSTCSSCHTIPPTSGAHQEHARTSDCSICHAGYSLSDSTTSASNHRNGSVNVDGTLGGGTYASPDSSCSNVYCHGAFTGGSGARVKWSSTVSGCAECHAAQPTTGSHPQHSTQKCSDCHTGYDPSTSTASAQKHIDAKVDVDATLSEGTYAAADKTCSNISCHTGTGARIWGSKSTCSSCHTIPPTSGAHQEHARTSDCSICHAGYSLSDSSTSASNHRNGSVNVDGTLGGGTYASPDSSCSNVYCHGAFTGGSGARVKWSSTISGCTECHAAQPTTGSHPQHSTQKCSECHTGYDVATSTISAEKHINAKVDVDATLSGGTYATTDKTCSSISCHTGTATRTWGASLTCSSCHSLSPTSGAHEKHASKYDCSTCHTGYSISDSSTSATNHRNGTVNVDGALGGGTYSAPDSSCSNVYCHGAFPGGSASKVKWSGSITGCTSCHASPPSSGSHTGHANEECSVCHNGYSAESGTVSASLHINQKLDMGGTIGGGAWSSADKSCSSVSCHGGTRVWGASACGSCHSLPPATGSHGKHTQTYKYDCNVCHNGYSLLDSSTSPNTHNDGTNNVDGKLRGGIYNTASKSCSNVYCHGSYTGGNATTPVWGGASIGCSVCHTLPNTRGAHLKHTATYNYACDTCHKGYTSASVTVATHADSIRTVNGSLGGGSYAASGNSCALTYCHGNFTGGTKATAQWYGAALTCSSCHGAPPSTGKHDRHTNRGITCGECHNGYDLATKKVSAALHVNNVKDAVFSGGGSFNKSTGRCQNVSCHVDRAW